MEIAKGLCVCVCVWGGGLDTYELPPYYVISLKMFRIFPTNSGALRVRVRYVTWDHQY